MWLKDSNATRGARRPSSGLGNPRSASPPSPLGGAEASVPAHPCLWVCSSACWFCSHAKSSWALWWPFSFSSDRLRLTFSHSLGTAASTQSTHTVVTTTTKLLVTAVPQRPVHYLSLNVLKLCIIDLANKSSLIYGFLCWRAYSLKIHNPSVCLYNPLVFTYLPT